jgi:pimeloyl-[acyl-carrier protein] synthase
MGMSETRDTELTQSVFDPIMEASEALLANPYPSLEQLRQSGSVVWSPRGNQWLVLGYEEANSILRSKKFGKRLLEGWKPPNPLIRLGLRVLSRRQGSSMLILDPPDHTRIRALVSSAFTPSVIHSLEPRIREIANELIDGMQRKLESGQEVDLISEFAFPLPVIVIAELLGVPAEDRAQFKRWSSKITMSFSGSVRPLRMAASYLSMQSLRIYLKGIIEKKRKQPQHDLISEMVKAQAEGYDKLSNAELLSNTVLILIAGHETTVNLIGNGVHTLLTHHQALEQVRAQPDLIPNAVEEVLRYDPPVQIVRRVATEDTELGGKSIKKDDVLCVLTAACNRDPQLTEDPGSFSVERQQIKHLTFGAGIHYCLGAELARTEAKIAFETLIARLPELRLADRMLRYKGPFAIRGLAQLYIRADAVQ